EQGAGGPATEGTRQGDLQHRVERSIPCAADAGCTWFAAAAIGRASRPTGPAGGGERRNPKSSRSGAADSGSPLLRRGAAAACGRPFLAAGAPRAASTGSRTAGSGVGGRAPRRRGTLLGLARARPAFPDREYRLVHRRVPRRGRLALLLARGLGVVRAAR